MRHAHLLSLTITERDIKIPKNKLKYVVEYLSLSCITFKWAYRKVVEIMRKFNDLL